MSGCIFNLYIHIIRTYSWYSTVVRYKCHSTPGMGPFISLAVCSQGYFWSHLYSYCNRPMSAGDGGWLPWMAMSPSPASPRPSCRHCGARTGRTALALSRPSWGHLGRPTVPGRPTGRLTSLPPLFIYTHIRPCRFLEFLVRQASFRADLVSCH